VGSIASKRRLHGLSAATATASRFGIRGVGIRRSSWRLVYQRDACRERQRRLGGQNSGGRRAWRRAHLALAAPAYRVEKKKSGGEMAKASVMKNQRENSIMA
jgi:hypothetical protein